MCAYGLHKASEALKVGLYICKALGEILDIFLVMSNSL